MDAERQALIEYLQGPQQPQQMPSPEQMAMQNQMRAMEAERRRAAGVPIVAREIAEYTGIPGAMRSAEAMGSGDGAAIASELLPMILGGVMGPAGRAGGRVMSAGQDALEKGMMKGMKPKPDSFSMRARGDGEFDPSGGSVQFGDRVRPPGPESSIVDANRRGNSAELAKAVSAALKKQPEVAGTVTREVAKTKGVPLNEAVERLGDRGLHLRQPNIQGRDAKGRFKKLGENAELARQIRSYNRKSEKE